MKRKSTAYVQFKARMKESLRAQLKSAAKKRGVSINAELIDRLERSFSEDELATRVVEIVRQVDAKKAEGK